MPENCWTKRSAIGKHYNCHIAGRRGCGVGAVPASCFLRHGMARRIAPFRCRECTPHFLCLRQRKRAVHGPKETAFVPQNGAYAPFLLRYGSGWLEVPTESISPLPGAPDSAGRTALPPQSELRRKFGEVGVWSLLLPSALSASLSAAGFKDPGDEVQNKGARRPPWSGRFKGVWGEFRNPPTFLEGFGEVSLRQRHLPEYPCTGFRCKLPCHRSEAETKSIGVFGDLN